MPWIGSAPNQTFQRTDGTRSGSQTWQQAQAAAVDIIATDHDTHDQDLGDAISATLKRDGGNAATANLPMGGFRHTNVGTALARTSYVQLGQLQDGGATFAVVGGTANAIVLTTGFSVSALVPGFSLDFFASGNNTGSVTVAVDGLTAKDLVRPGNVALQPNDLISGAPYRAVYNGAYFLLQAGGAGLQQGYGLKIGDVKMSLSSSPDAGFIRLAETTQNLLKTDYPDLNAWAAAQSYPWGSTSTTFGIPPAAGYFPRFIGTTSSIDPDGPRTPGSTQNDGIKDHVHTGTTSAVADHTHSYNAGAGHFGVLDGGLSASQTPSAQTTGAAGGHSHTFSTSATTGSVAETRPKNVAFYVDMLAVPALVASGLVGAVGFAFKFNSATSAADPGAGYFALNNATVASATALYISETDSNATSLAAVLAAVPANSTFYITKVGAPSKWIACTASTARTDNGSWNTFTITDASASAGAIANGDQCNILVMRAGKGTTGDKGDPGLTGPNTAEDYAFDTGTSDADPGAGKVRIDNATIASATFAYINKTDRSGNSRGAVIGRWDDSTNTAHLGHISVFDVATRTKGFDAEVTSTFTDGTAYWKIPLSSVVARSGGLPSAGDVLAVVWDRTGNKGSDGVGAGDVAGPSSSVDSEIALFSSTTGKIIKRASTTGLLKAASGVLSAATAGTDYLAPPAGTSLLKGNSGGALANAVANTDYLTPPAGSSLLKANSGGALANAVSGTDYCPATSGSSVLKGNGSGGTSSATAGTGNDYVAPGTQTSFTKQQGFGIATLTDAAPIAWDVSVAQSAKVTIAASRTISAVSNAVEGFVYSLMIIQDATGSRLITWTTSGAGSFDFGTDGAPTLTTTASKGDLVSFLAVSIGGTLKLRFCGIKKGFA